jgi:kynurenine formamidase
VLSYLDEDRDIAAIGHETPDTDPGAVASGSVFPLESYHLQQDKYQIEMLSNLDKVPEFGALIIAAWPKAQDASGFPARVFALLP